MTRDQIITELFKSKEFNDCIRKMEPKHLQDDLKSEVMLILCEKAPFVIEELHSKGELKYYAVRIILNLIQSGTSPFYKKFRGNNAIDVSSMGKIERSSTRELVYGAKKFINSGIPDYDWGDEEGVIKIENRLTEEKKNELRMMEVFNLPWYPKELILMYLEHGNYRAIQKETTIEHTSVYKTINKAIKKIDEAVELRMIKARPYEPDELIEYITRADRRQAIDYLNNVLHYYKSSYPSTVLGEIKRRSKEREQRFIDQELKPNIA